jgi:DinB family protein
MAMMEP